MNDPSQFELTFWDLMAFGGFFVVLSAIGYLAGRRERTSPDEYFLAGRKLPWYVVGGSFIASNISSEHFLGMIGKKAARDFGAMNRAVVEKEVDVAAFVAPQQMLEKDDEFGAALTVGQQERDATGQGVECAEDGRAAILSRRRNGAVLADQPPHAAQAGIEMEFAFILEEDGVTVGMGRDFFKAASRSRLARRTAWGFCLCLRESFGRL